MVQTVRSWFSDLSHASHLSRGAYLLVLRGSRIMALLILSKDHVSCVRVEQRKFSDDYARANALATQMTGESRT